VDRYLKQTKCLFFSLKNGGQDCKSGPVWRWVSLGGGDKERVEEVNMVEMLCLMYENGKMRSAETALRMRRGDKGE
jgi:hypothetical protein